MSIENRKRRLFHENPPYSAVRTVIPKTAVFERLTVYRYGKKTDWQAVKKHLKAFSKAVVFTDGCEPDENSGIFEFQSNRLMCVLLINSAIKILEYSYTKPQLISLSVLDKTGTMSGKISPLVPLCGKITVFTENKMKYSFFASEMLESFGALVRVLDWNEEKGNSDIFLNLSNSGINPLSVTLFNGKYSLSGGEIDCPEGLLKYKPDGLKTYAYLSALFSLCSVSEAGSLYFDTFRLGSREISLQTAAKMLDRKGIF